ncbi:MAG: hypothetical protein Q9161_006258 [Pseudevernia consocians]
MSPEATAQEDALALAEEDVEELEELDLEIELVVVGALVVAKVDAEVVAATASLLLATTAAAVEEDELILLELGLETVLAFEVTLELIFVLKVVGAAEELVIALEETPALAVLETAEEATLDTAEEATLGVDAALDVLDPTAILLLIITFAVLAEDELILDVLEAAGETMLDVWATLEELALAVLDTAEEATLEATFELECATLEDEPTLVELETAEEATTELEVGATTEDALDEPATLLLIATLAEADEDVLLWIALELEDLVLDADVLELDTTLEDANFVLDTTVLELGGVLDPVELDVADLIVDELEIVGADEELELAFVDDTELLDATVDEGLGALVEEEDVELED